MLLRTNKANTTLLTTYFRARLSKLLFYKHSVILNDLQALFENQNIFQNAFLRDLMSESEKELYVGAQNLLTKLRAKVFASEW